MLNRFSKFHRQELTVPDILELSSRERLSFNDKFRKWRHRFRGDEPVVLDLAGLDNNERGRFRLKFNDRLFFADYQDGYADQDISHMVFNWSDDEVPDALATVLEHARIINGRYIVPEMHAFLGNSLWSLGRGYKLSDSSAVDMDRSIELPFDDCDEALAILQSSRGPWEKVIGKVGVRLYEFDSCTYFARNYSLPTD